MGRLTPDQIRNARAKLNLSRKALAELCGVSARTITAWEQGWRSPSRAALILLERALEAKDE